MTQEPIVELSKAYRYYRPGNEVVKALNGVSLKIEPGEFVAVMGPSGCGKSTLLRTIGLLDPLTRGALTINGQRAEQATPQEAARLRKQHIGFVFQDFKLIDRLTLQDNVVLPLKYRNIARSDRRDLAHRALDMVGLADRVHHKPYELSGGQMQRAAIARAVVSGPDIVLADEPTGNLDEDSSATVLELFKQLNGTGRTIVMVTHSEHDASHADRILRMRDGKMEDGTKATKVAETSI